jgi:hypothetical protein
MPPEEFDFETILKVLSRILDLAMLIVTKQEAGREKDKLVLPILRRTLEEINRGRSGQA